MIKMLTAIVTMVAVLATPARAGNDEAAALIGGLFLGAIIANSGDRAPSVQHNTYVYEVQPAPQPRLIRPYRKVVCSEEIRDYGYTYDLYSYDCRGNLIKVETYYW